MLLLLAMFAASPVAAIDWPSVPVPEGVRGERVSDHMRYNGLDMRASVFHSDQPIAKVRAFYLKQWQGQVADTPLPDGASVLGHLSDGRYYTTIKLVPDGAGTRGQIGIMSLPYQALPANTLGAGFARMPATEVAEDIVYLDTPQKVRSLRMVNHYSPYQTERFYTQTLTAQGYRAEPQASPCQNASALCQVRYVRDQQRVTVTAMRGKIMTQIVAVIE